MLMYSGFLSVQSDFSTVMGPNNVISHRSKTNSNSKSTITVKFIQHP